MEKPKRTTIHSGASTAMPLYRQIKIMVQSKISSGDWRIGAKLPTEHELVQLLGVSRMTISRALNELTASGVLTRKPGVGTFVAERPVHAALFEISDIAREIEARGRVHSNEVLALERLRATDFISERLNLPTGSEVFYSKVLHFSSGDEVQLEERWINPLVAPEYGQQNFTTMTTFDYLATVAPTTALDQSVHAVLPRRAEVPILNIDPATPCLLIVQRTWSGKLVVSTNRMVSPGNRHSLGGHLSVHP